MTLPLSVDSLLLEVAHTRTAQAQASNVVHLGTRISEKVWTSRQRLQLDSVSQSML